MGKKLSEDIIKQIPILYSELGKKSKVAEALNIAPSTVSKYLNLIEAAPTVSKEIKEPKKRTKVDDEMIEKINNLYKSCKNLSKVGKELGISAATVRNHLNEENLKLKESINDDRDALWFYIFKLFGKYSDEKPVSDWNITQMYKFQNMGMTYRGQLLALKYFYEVKKGDIKKSRGSIGIITYVYDEARVYYQNQAKKADEISEGIQKQLEQDRIEIKYNPSDYMSRKKKKKIDLNSIGGDN